MAVVLLDASEPISEQDQRDLTMVTEAGRALVIAFNKWDLVDEDRRYLPGQGDRPGAAADPVGASGQRLGQDRPGGGQARPGAAPGPGQLGTPGADRQLNQWLTALVQATPHPVRGGRSPRVLFATQAGRRPPTFVLFTTGQLDPGYVRFVERKLREEFDFTGTPVAISVRPRKRQADKKN